MCCTYSSFEVFVYFDISFLFKLLKITLRVRELLSNSVRCFLSKISVQNKYTTIMLLYSGIIIFLFCVFIICYIIYVTRFARKFVHIPQPEAFPVIGHILDLLVDEVILFKKLRQWSRNYGPVFNLFAFQFLHVNITGPEEFEIVASSLKNNRKSYIYDFLHCWLGEGLLTSTGPKWQLRRKILTPAFHFSILQQFLTIFNNETDRLVHILKNWHEPYVNVVPLVSQFTLYGVTETSMGVKLDVNNEKDRSFVKATQRTGKIIVYRILRPWIYSDIIFNYLSQKGYYQSKLIRTIHDFCNNIIKHRSSNFNSTAKNTGYNYSQRKKLAMIDILLKAKMYEGLVNDKDIQDEVNTFIFEGHDTTAACISFTLMLLANHKDTQDKIYEEIIEILGESPKDPTMQELNDLKFMERCIKESLRLYPSVPLISRQPEEDIITKDYVIPKEAVVNLHIYDIHRNPKHWPDAEKFDPDRFLPENCINRHPFAFVPFSAGPRNCIGQKFAFLEIKAVLCGILRNFILEPVDTPETITLTLDIILRTKDEEIKVKFVPRH